MRVWGKSSSRRPRTARCAAVKLETCILWSRHGNFSRLRLNKVSTRSRHRERTSPGLAGFCFSNSFFLWRQSRDDLWPLNLQSQSQRSSRVTESLCTKCRYDRHLALGLDVNSIFGVLRKEFIRTKPLKMINYGQVDAGRVVAMYWENVGASGDMKEGADDLSWTGKIDTHGERWQINHSPSPS